MCDLKGGGVQVPTCAVSGLHPACESYGGVCVSKDKGVGPPEAGRAGQPGGLRAEAPQSKAGDPHLSLEGGSSAPAQLICRKKR